MGKSIINLLWWGENLNKLLKELRAQRGLTQKDVAELLHISRPTYTRYETGERKPDYETLRKLSEIFNVSTDYLIGVNNIDYNQYGVEIYKKLIDIGFLKQDEPVTEEHLSVLSSIIAPQLDYAHFKLHHKKNNTKK